MQNQMTQDLYKVHCPINGVLVRTFESACDYQKGMLKVAAARSFAEQDSVYMDLARMIKVEFWKTITF